MLRPRSAPKGTPGAALAGISALAVVLVLLLAGQAEGRTITSVSAPYSGASPLEQLEKGARPSGCGVTSQVLTQPSFNTSSGLARYGIAGQVRGCSHQAGQEVVWWKLGLTDLPVTVPTTGTYNLSVRWTAVGSFNATVLKNGSAPRLAGSSFNIQFVLCTSIKGVRPVTSWANFSPRFPFA
jgi:hypothetical protein